MVLPPVIQHRKYSMKQNIFLLYSIRLTFYNSSYGETMMHLFKGNIGTGMFALGDAFKNAGVITAPILTFALAVVSVHCQHVLLTCSRKMQEANKINFLPDFAETVELCFQNGPPKLRSWAPWMKTVVNIFICVTQLGFCCIYFVFISTNLKQVRVLSAMLQHF